MALISKGKVITGTEAKKNSVDKKITKETLTEQEIDFVLTKLRQANYKGVEFEMFYNVFTKLSGLKK
tara:strand:+ start:495 stop:695 length:201 start_codon:yes stop_codon:yes gene_type:complete